MVKTLVGQAHVPGANAWILLPTQLPVSASYTAYPGWAAFRAQEVVSWTAMSEKWIEFPGPSFGLVQWEPTWAFGR